MEQYTLERINGLFVDEVQFLKKIIDSSPDPTMVIGLNHELFLCNKAVRNIWIGEEINKKTNYCYRAFYNNNSPCDGVNHCCPLKEVIKTGTKFTTIHCHVDQLGQEKKFEVTASPLHDNHDHLVGIIEVHRDVTQRLAHEANIHKSKKTLEYIANHDALTRLPNRHLFKAKIEEISQRARLRNEKFALLFLDLDHFKKVNDTFGHDIGDQLLVEVTRDIRYQLRKSDVLSRMGGDEFLLILNNVKDAQEVSCACQRIIKTLDRERSLDGCSIYVTASIGVSFYPADGKDTTSLIKNADIAMYKAKEAGRNSYQFYNEEMSCFNRLKMDLEIQLHRAIEKKEFILFYQPQFNLSTGQLIGVEALLRWNHPNRGLVQPSQIIPIAEETGLIIQIGEVVLRQACEQIAKWENLECPPVKIAINVSGLQFERPGFVELVKKILAETKISPNLLELEITESSIMGETESSIDKLFQLKKLGISLAIDDFGTGYSSLHYLRLFPVSKLKIDRSFVSGIPAQVDNGCICSSIIALAHSLQLEVVAEGVEEEEQAEWLIEQKCEYVQGFLFSRPLPAVEIEKIYLKPPQCLLSNG